VTYVGRNRAGPPASDTPGHRPCRSSAVGAARAGARLEIFEDGGALRWTLVSAVDGTGINGSGTASLAGDQVKLIGAYTGRLTATRGQGVAIEYTARLDGETLQGAGVGADSVPQKFTLKRAGR
jgi:hypothetical protein